MRELIIEEREALPRNARRGLVHVRRRLPAHVGSVARRAGVLVVVLAVLLTTGGMVRAVVSTGAGPVEAVCRSAAGTGHYRLAMRFCRGCVSRRTVPARSANGAVPPDGPPHGAP
jgi:hypothetical protein